jgi:hypothetical protein
MGYNLLGCGIEVNRLKRGGCLFEGIAQNEREEYIIRTRGAWTSLIGRDIECVGVAVNQEGR